VGDDHNEAPRGEGLADEAAVGLAAASQRPPWKKTTTEASATTAVGR
jgi:hypothetical protein